ncbi:hypothetical protein Efla_000075 [Eimeria flavescens]
MSRSSALGSPGRRSRSRCRERVRRRDSRSPYRGAPAGLAGGPPGGPRSSKRHGTTRSSKPEWDRERDRAPWRERESSRQQQLRQPQQQQLLPPSHRSSRRASLERGGGGPPSDRRGPSSREYEAVYSSRQRDRHSGRDRDRDRGRERDRDRDRQTKARYSGHPFAEAADCESVSASSRASQRRRKQHKPTGRTEATWRPSHREEGSGRRAPRRLSCSSSWHSSSWHSSNESSMGSAGSAAAAEYRRAAAAEAAGSKRSSHNRRDAGYRCRGDRHQRAINGGLRYAPGGGGPSYKAEAPASPPRAGNSSSKHKVEGRSRRETGAEGGGSSKKSSHREHQRQGSRKSSKKQQKEAIKDEITHFSWEPGMWLNDRYRVLAKLGDGTFGRVLKCADVRQQTLVAIKVVRDVARYTSAAHIEADILREVNRKDRRRDSHCVSLLDAFMHHQRHMCLVFECLGKSLYDVLSENKYRGFYVADIVHVARQGLMALSFMRDCKLAHTDLKPENILLQGEEMIETRPPRPTPDDDGASPFLRPASMQVKIIDFGSATFADDYHSSLINTRQYRAPEVILGIGWDMASDMWSLGCILMELYTGDVLFRTHEHMEHLAMIERIVEPFPNDMLVKAQKGFGKGYVFVDSRKSARLRWPEGAASQGSLERVKNCVPLENLVLPQHRPLAEFVRFLLQVDPNKRPEPKDALRHSIFSVQLWEH